MTAQSNNVTVSSISERGTTGHLETLRRFEVDAVDLFFRHGCKVLDVGGGTGFQAKMMAERGCEVLSIDVSGSGAYAQFFPVRRYDGVTLPVPSESVDVIFSSNVLEHVTNLPALLREMHRAIKPDGLLIHILPSPSWRFWTSLAFYAYVIKNLLGKGELVEGTDSIPITLQRSSCAIQRRGFVRAAGTFLTYPFRRHGEFPNALAELYYFSRYYWKTQFVRNGFAVQEVYGNGMFYTGHSVLPHLSYVTRRYLSRILGSSCNIFILRKEVDI
jgi:SAM-dependent methyltransferase